MTTYEQLKIGQVYYTKAGPDLPFIKLGDGDLTLDHSGIRCYTKDDTEVFPVGPEPILAEKRVTHLERVALLLLTAHGQAIHPALESWKNAIISDANFKSDIWEYIVEMDDAIKKSCESQGFILPDHLLLLLCQCKPAGDNASINNAYYVRGGRYDSPLAILCHAVFLYRIGYFNSAAELVSAILEYHEKIRSLDTPNRVSNYEMFVSKC